MAKKDKLTYEERLEQIQTVILKMENKEITLEDSIANYKKGMELIASCQQELEEAEKELTVIEKQELKVQD